MCNNLNFIFSNVELCTNITNGARIILNRKKKVKFYAIYDIDKHNFSFLYKIDKFIDIITNK